MTWRRRLMWLLLTLALAVPASLAGVATAPSTGTGRVLRGIDGDTIVVHLDGQDEKVRYIGVSDPPAQAGGFRARNIRRVQAALRLRYIARETRLPPQTEVAGSPARIVRRTHMRRHFVRLAVISAAWLVGCALPPTASQVALQRYRAGLDASEEALQRFQASGEEFDRALQQAMVQWQSFVEPLTGNQRDALAGVMVQHPTMASLDSFLALLTPEQAKSFDEHMRTRQWLESWIRHRDGETKKLREQLHALTRLGQETEAMIRAEYQDSVAVRAGLQVFGQGLQQLSNTMRQDVYNDAVLWQLRTLNTNIERLQRR